jgi:catechol 2,3-dioxygenase-like lactoylglutathione lyase family enzyme
MSLPLVDAAVKFHLSLNVSNLQRSLAFYRVLFGLEPSKCHPDYAKFDLESPPVVFSLVPQTAATGGPLSHLGLRVADEEAIAAVRERLAAAGIATQTQEGTVCGYARQNKCWAADPDSNFWEVYTVEEDVGPCSVRRSLEGAAARLEAPEPPAGPVVWEHYVTQPPPEHIPHAGATVDEVRLSGTFNADLTEAQRARLVGEAFRVLRPGGKVIVHGLMGDRSLPGTQPRPPGLGAMVSRVPPQSEPLLALKAAGFGGVQFTKLSETAWFRHDGVALREVKLLGWKPAALPAAEAREVVYKGPFREAVDDGGNVYPRGRKVAVAAADWDLLRRGPAAEQFLFLTGAEATGGCG